MLFQFEEIIAALTEMNIVYQIGSLLLGLLLTTLFLRIGLKAVGGRHIEFGTVFITALIGFVLDFIPCIGCIILWFVIKSRHETSLGGAIGAWLLAFLIPIVIVVVIVLLLVGGFALIANLFS